jgi:hypothetical protein
MEGRGHGIIDVLFRQLHGGTEDNPKEISEKMAGDALNFVTMDYFSLKIIMVDNVFLHRFI